MENKAYSKRIMLATLAIFALAMMQQIHKGEGACPAAYDDPCTTPNTLCCESDPTLTCIEVSPGVKRCKDSTCEEHLDHECYPGYFGCCDGMTCAQVSSTVYKCKEGPSEEHSGHECNPGYFECCPTSGLTCAQSSPGVYQCM